MPEDKYDEMRAEREAQEEHRQALRDEAMSDTGEADDEGSQDERRKEGRDRL